MLLLILSLPLSLIQRYRVGKARRPARKWPIALNLGALLLSAAIFLWTAALTNFWVPRAFAFALLGFLAGIGLGLLGLLLTRWEETPRALHFTPNRWLILLLTLAIASRIVYGFWRGWSAWGNESGAAWLAATGVAGSLAVGATVLAYYVTYFAGVLFRLRRKRARS